jgi:hypothetical protein
MMGAPDFGDTPAASLLHASPSDTSLPRSVSPQRPAQDFPFAPRPIQGSGHNLGYGGYTATFSQQGRYGEMVDDDRKSMDDIELTSGRPQVVDLRGPQWGMNAANPYLNSGPHAPRPDSDDSLAAAPGAYPTALAPAPRAPSDPNPLLNPFDDAHSPTAQRPPALQAPLPTTRRTFQLSDPPVSHHTPLPSDASEYEASLLPPSEHTPAPSYHSYAHGAEGSYASHDSQETLHAHPHDISDSSFYDPVETQPAVPFGR